MKMRNLNFSLASGTVPGWRHLQRGPLLKGINNQDASRKFSSSELLVAIVCDGCGSYNLTDFGAKWGVDHLMAACQRNWLRYRQAVSAEQNQEILKALLEDVRLDVLAEMRNEVNATFPVLERMSKTAYTSERFSFTSLLLIATPFGGMFAGIGDGCYAVNGEFTAIPEYSGNEPPYLVYNLVKTKWQADDLKFKIHREFAEDELQSFLVGTDGVIQLAKLGDCNIPGQDQLVGDLSQFWTEDRYLEKDAGIDKRLRLYQSSRHLLVPGSAGTPPAIKLENQLLEDDTTFVVGSRRKAEQ
jgi:hypothetical protein